MNIYFDIETAPLPREEALRVAPAFEPDARMKDPAKIAADLDAKEQKWMERCALDPLTGQVVLFGWCNDANPEPRTMDMMKNDERKIVSFAVENMNDAIISGSKIIGFNIRSFDLPFLLRRAVILDLPLPTALRNQAMYRYSESIVDLMDVWLFGDRDMKGQSLANIALRCGIGTKTDEGKFFSDLMQTDYEAAVEYARNDIRLTYSLGKRMGF